MKNYLFLAAAIVLETLGTTFLNKSAQFTKLLPTVIFLLAMGGSFYMLSHALKEIPIGIAYAIWSAAGIVLISIIGYFVFKQSLDLPAIIGVAFIIIGVIIINVFSKTSAH